MMTAKELLELMRLGGYSIQHAGGSIEVSPQHSVDNEMIELIKRHKSELIKLLEREQAHGN